MHLHEELKKAREEAGLTQAELATIAGLPRNQVVRAEKGDNITLDTLRRIAAHLPVTQLTLMHNVALTADILPAPQKIYLGAMATLHHMTQALGSAVGLAMAARVAMETANSREPLYEEAGVERPAATEDEVLLLKSLKNWYHNLERTVYEQAGIDFPGEYRKMTRKKDDPESPEAESEAGSEESEA